MLKTIQQRMPSWWKWWYWLQALNVLVIIVNVTGALLAPNFLTPLQWVSAGFMLCLILANIRIFSLIETLTEMNTALHAMMELKTAEIGEQIAAHFQRDPEAPRITKH